MRAANQRENKSDEKIMARLRKPINELVDKYCSNKTEYQRLRLRQLTWQAVDVLVRTGNVAHLKREKDVQRIIRNIREVGASEEFIEESLSLAGSIYEKMQIDYPSLLKRYRG